MNSKTFLLSSIFTVGVVTGLSLISKTGPSTPANSTEPAQLPVSAAPSWELNDVDGKLVKSTDFAGKVVLLDFWATWCGPCRMEIPGFVELQSQYSRDGLVVIGVSVDEDALGVVKPFVAKMGVNYPVLMSDERIVDSFGGIEGIPTTFIIDRSGRIAGKHVGYAPKDVFERDIQPLLKQ